MGLHQSWTCPCLVGGARWPPKMTPSSWTITLEQVFCFEVRGHPLICALCEIQQHSKGNRRRSKGYCPHLWKSQLQPFQPEQQSHLLWVNYCEPVYSAQKKKVNGPGSANYSFPIIMNIPTSTRKKIFCISWAVNFLFLTTVLVSQAVALLEMMNWLQCRIP